MRLKNSLDPRTEDRAVAHGDLEVRDETEQCQKFPERGGPMPQCCEPPGKRGAPWLSEAGFEYFQAE